MVKFSFAVAQKIAYLDIRILQLVNKGLGPSYKNYRVMANAYQKFCEKYEFTPFPADKIQIRRYMAHLTATHETAESTTNYVSGVRILHELAAFDPPNTDNLFHKVQYRGIKRENKLNL